MARPTIEIDPIMVHRYAKLGCTNKEIADFMGCSPETLERRFAPEMAKGRSELRTCLRRWQIKAAKGGNTSMLIWLGKQMLGQREPANIDLTTVDDEIFAKEALRRLNVKNE